MQAVPSLIGTGTAVAAAATGFVFAQSTNEKVSQKPSAARPTLLAEFVDASFSDRPLTASRLSNVSLTSTTYARNTGPARQPTPVATSNTLSAVATLPRSAGSSHYPPSTSRTRRHSFVHKSEWAAPITGASQDSISSNGSWIRRLSMRPLSQHGSTRSQHGSMRSSIDPDSMNVSLGSATPMLPQSPSQALRQPARNKLVKRSSTATQVSDPNGASLSRPGSRSQIPTLRRPATSHQRSATLQMLPQTDDLVASAVAQPKLSFDQRTRLNLAIFRVGAETPDSDVLDRDDVSVRELSQDFSTEAPDGRLRSFHWVSFFHARVSRNARVVTSRGSSPFPLDESPSSSSSSQHPILPCRTIHVQQGTPTRPYLTLASTVAMSMPGSGDSPIDKTTRKDGEESTSSPQGLNENSSPEDTPSKRARRSISMHFTSPTNWISRTGSIRRPKRGSSYSTSTTTTSSAHASSQFSVSPTTFTGGTRHVSAPLSTTSPILTQNHGQTQPRSVTAPANMPLRKPDEVNSRPIPLPCRTDHDQKENSRGSSNLPLHVDSRLEGKRQRNTSSPLPPLSRLSSFNVDLSRLRSSTNTTAVASALQKANQAPRSFPLIAQTGNISKERPLAFVGSEHEMRGFASSGDDDTDLKSDTIFDSIRTTASTRARLTDTPVESMFDESPPSTASNSKTKRLSIQEILGQAWDSDTRIMEEEDEGFSTPIRSAVAKPARGLSTSVASHYGEADYFDSSAQLSRASMAEIFDVRSVLVPTEADTDADAYFALANGTESGGKLSTDIEDDDECWSRMNENGVTNCLSPPSRPLSSFSGAENLFHSGYNGAENGVASIPQRSALKTISGNGSPDMIQQPSEPRNNLFGWSESSAHLDKMDAEGHSPRPKTVHGKKEMDLRNGRPPNRRGPVAAHVRSQSVPVISDPVEGPKPSTSKFGTWASGPMAVSEYWDDDFDFGTNQDEDVESIISDDFDFGDGADGQQSTLRSGKAASSGLGMVVPASIQATQPTVKAHSGQIRELSLLVDSLKRLCRHARDLNIVNESPALWAEAENIIALASPEEDQEDQADQAHTGVSIETAPEEKEFEFCGIDDRFLEKGFDGSTSSSFDDDAFDRPTEVQVPLTTLSPPEMSKTAVVRERQNGRRRSVFSPEDDIFGGGWPLPDGNKGLAAEAEEDRSSQKTPPKTPPQLTDSNEAPNSAMIESIMEAMQQQRSSSAPIKSPVKQTPTSELFFNTNTLQELVKRASSLFHTLSDLVRRAELIMQSPTVTPRHDRLNRLEDGSPAFTRVFTDPSSPSRKLPQSHSNNSVLSRGASPSLESPTSNSIGQRFQMMTVS